MKRIKVKPEVKLVSSVFPLFKWLECETCKEEFVREKGWLFRVRTQQMEPIESKYICCKCAPSDGLANEQAGVIAESYREYCALKLKSSGPENSVLNPKCRLSRRDDDGMPEVRT